MIARIVLTLSLLLSATIAAAQNNIDAAGIYLWNGGVQRIYLTTGSGAPSGGATGYWYVDYLTGDVYTKLSVGWEKLPRVSAANTWTAAQAFNAGFTADTSTLVVDAVNHRVGIGTASPARILTVNGGANSSRLLLQNAASGSSIADGFDVVLDTSGNAQVWNYEAGYLALATSNAERVRVDASGNVGVGLTGPIFRLHVKGAVAGGVVGEFLDAGGTHAIYLRPNASGVNLISSNFETGSAYLPLALSARENTSDLYLSTTGNVGIGTTGPSSKLDVNGQATFRSDLMPYVAYASMIGSLPDKFLALYAAELWVETLVQQNTIATIGGRILVGPTTSFVQDVSSSAGDPGATGGMVTMSGVSLGAAAPGCAVDGVTAQQCWHTDTAVAGATITVDFGAANDKLITKARVYAFSGTSAAVWKLQRSTDNSTWGDVCTLPALVSGWNQCYTKGSQSAARYWRLYLTNTPGAGAWQGELELTEEFQIHSKYNNLTTGTSGDVVYAEANGSVEFFHVNEGGSGSAGNYTYYVTRDIDQSGRNAWYAGDALFNTGHAGSGFIDLYSIAGVKSASEAGPTIVGNVRASNTYNDWAPRWAIGNLNHLYGYSADTYGVAMGDPSATNIIIDATNGLRIRSGTTDKLTADTSGNLALVGDLSIGTSGDFRSGATAIHTGVGWWMDYNGGSPRFRIGDPAGNEFYWDGSNLVVGSGLKLCSDAGCTLSATLSTIVNNGVGWGGLSTDRIGANVWMVTPELDLSSTGGVIKVRDSFGLNYLTALDRVTTGLSGTMLRIGNGVTATEVKTSLIVGSGGTTAPVATLEVDGNATLTAATPTLSIEPTGTGDILEAGFYEPSFTTYGIVARYSSTTGALKFNQLAAGTEDNTTPIMALNRANHEAAFGATAHASNATSVAVRSNQSSAWGLEVSTSTNVGGGVYVGFLNAAGTTQGSITATNSTTTAYNTTSDQRLKTDRGLHTSVDELRALRIHDFTWKTNGDAAVGVFAQEAVRVLPAMITPGSDVLGPDGLPTRPWSADYSKLTPYLVVGWQDHDRRIAALEAEIARLKGAKQ